MSEQLKAAISEDFLSIIEDAILAGGFDDLVLARLELLHPCALRPTPSRRKRYDRRSWN